MEAHTNPGTYPGNPSLPREVKEKILSTFRHTLNLFKDGKLDDCVIGCDFILKMDARFAPARSLLEKARNPSAEVDVSQLEALVATTPTRQERVVAADPNRLLVRAVESFNARDFDAAISAAEQVLTVLPGNQDAGEILDKARSKKANQPVFDACRQRALTALEENRREDARAELEKMRGLDPDHPAVPLLERRIGPSSAAAPALAPTPPPPPDFGGLDLDFSEPTGGGGGFGNSLEQPDIHFDDGHTVALKVPPLEAPTSPGRAFPAVPDGLDALSLDSLSLDLPPSVEPVEPPPSESRSSLRGPLQDAAPNLPPEVPGAAPGSPADMWADGGDGLSLDGGGTSAHVEPFSSTPMSSEPEGFGALEPQEEDSAAGDREIAALLKQGDDAARRGERQQAIEVWSRIFLIDINNSEAVTRIEKARQEMAEGNRRISDGLKTGREAYEAGDLPGARELFLAVLAVDESEPTARFYLDRIQAEMASPVAGASGEAAEPWAPEAGSVPAAPASAAAVKTAAAPAPGRSLRFPVSRRILAMVGLFGALVLGLVYFLVWRVPRPAAKAAAPAAAAGLAPGGASGSLARARQLLGAGKIGEARLELRRIPPSSPDHEEAARMQAELGKSGSSPGPGVVAIEAAPSGEAAAGAPAAPVDAEPARIRLAAERALKEKRYIEALKTFSQAAPAFKNDPTFGQSMGVAAEKVTALTPAVKLYNEGEYETAIPVLWRIYQEDRENQDARTYLLRAYYNQGVTQLQNGLYPKAIQSFGEALSIDPGDAEAIRHRKFGERYLKSDLDLMGRIYVRHLNHRP
ncbi:MAG: hypothetical protein ABJC07_12200 [Acidobacteriota bacterium]